MEKKIKVKRIIWSILLIIAILPFVITLSVGVYHSIVGAHDGICIMCNDRELIYGLEAFKTVITFTVYIVWPVYVIALIVIILAIIRLVMLRRKPNNNQVQ